MPLSELDYENADRDLTSAITVLTHTPSATEAKVCLATVLLGDGVKNLAGIAGDYVFTVFLDGVLTETKTVDFGTETQGIATTDLFTVAAGAVVTVKALSPNGGDTDVDVTAYLYEIIYDSAIGAGLAVSLAEAKTQLRIDASDTSHDTHVTTLITAARILCEGFLGRYLLSGSRIKRFDSFCEKILLPQPLTSVVITYLDTGGNTQTLDAATYDIDASDENKPCGRVCLAYGQSWPATLDQKEAVTVTFVCGWASATDILEPIRQGLLLAVESLFDGRPELMEVAESLWWPHRWVPI